jgi:hypothetical protein
MVLIYDENNNLYKIIYDEKQIKTNKNNNIYYIYDILRRKQKY